LATCAPRAREALPRRRICRVVGFDLSAADGSGNYGFMDPGKSFPGSSDEPAASVCRRRAIFDNRFLREPTKSRFGGRRLSELSVRRVMVKETSGSHMAGREFFPDRSESGSKSTDGCYQANRVQSWPLERATTSVVANLG
jgi:hypothetical protein